MPAYSTFLVIHITFAAVAIPLLCYSLYKLYRSKPFNTKWTLSHIYLTSLLTIIFCLPTSLVYGTKLFVFLLDDESTTAVNIADRIIPAHSTLCVIQAEALSFLLAPYILLPVLLSFYTFNAIRKNKASLESQSFKYAAGAIWGLGGVILIGNIISWRSQMIQEETVRHDHKQGNVSLIFDGIQTRGWVCQAHYVNNTFTYVIDGVFILALFTGLVLSVMSFSMIFSIWRRQIRRHAIGFRYSICITFATFLFTATHLPIFCLSGLIFSIDPNGSIIPRSFIIFSSCEILVGTYLLLILGGTYDGMHNEENEEVAGKDGLEDGNITVSELRFTYFV